MVKTLKYIIQMKTTLWINSFIFYYQKLWIIGKWMPDSMYSEYDVKKVFSIVALILNQLILFSGKFIYLLCFIGFPLILYGADSNSFVDLFPLMVHILFFVNCLLGSLGDSQIFTVTRDKITCIKYLHMNSRTYIQGFLLFKYVPMFLYFFPCLIIAAKLTGQSSLYGIFIWLMLVSFRMMGEALQLFVFDRTGKVLSRNIFWSWLIMVLGIGGAYLPMLFGGNLPFLFGRFLMNPICIVIYTVLGAASLWYISIGYQSYDKKYHRSIDVNYLLSTMLKSSSGTTSASFREVEMKESDIEESVSTRKIFADFKGYSYINAIFFARHRRQLIKPIIYRIVSAGLIFAAAIIYLLINREGAVSLSQNLTVLLPYFIYIMYFMTVADKASRAMFYNCDKDMLRYAYYREPATVLKNFKIRLIRVSIYDLIIAGAVCLFSVTFSLICGTSLFSMDLLLFCITLLLLSVLFTTHHLCLYYIFQPYSESLQVKNPFFSMINIGMYVICFLCLQIKTGGLMFTVGTLLFTVLYIAVALILVYFKAPGSFRVK